MISRLMIVAALAAAAPASAQPFSGAPKPKAPNDCVYITQLGASHPLGDRSVIFRANVSDFYRLDFAQSCSMLTFPNPRLTLTPVGGIGLICHALDVDVKVGEQEPNAISEPCIASAWHKMTPAEVAAVPKKDLP